MLDFESARKYFVEVASILDVESVPLHQALGRVLAQDLAARVAVPAFDISAMDGYALSTQDIRELPYRLCVEGEAPAGAVPKALRAGTAMRIYTGAAVPGGADAVVMQEHVRIEAGKLIGANPVQPGQHVRRKGEDLVEGSIGLRRGQRLTSTAVALAHFLNYGTVDVCRVPRIAIICTGSELRRSESDARPGSIVESNSQTIAALSMQAGAQAVANEIVADDPIEIGLAIQKALTTAHVLITIGGVSVGDYDFVRPALQASGVVIDLHKVAIKPGKPITLGRRERQIVIGLPGNPASAVITFALFGIPLLRAMQGDKHPISTPTWVPILNPIRRDSTRTRIILGSSLDLDSRSYFVSHPSQSAGTTVALGQVDGFAILEAGPEPLESGELIRYCRWTDL